MDAIRSVGHTSSLVMQVIIKRSHRKVRAKIGLYRDGLRIVALGETAPMEGSWMNTILAGYDQLAKANGWTVQRRRIAALPNGENAPRTRQF